MIATLRRYVRAFVLALRYTLRGEKPPLSPQRALQVWSQETLTLITEIERVAQAAGLNPSALIIHVDKRDISMATILAAVRYHAEREYAYLLAHPDQFSRLTLEATNMNDRHLVLQLSQHINAPITINLKALDTHLAALPANHKEEV